MSLNDASFTNHVHLPNIPLHKPFLANIRIKQVKHHLPSPLIPRSFYLIIILAHTWRGVCSISIHLQNTFTVGWTKSAMANHFCDHGEQDQKDYHSECEIQPPGFFLFFFQITFSFSPYQIILSPLHASKILKENLPSSHSPPPPQALLPIIAIAFSFILSQTTHDGFFSHFLKAELMKPLIKPFLRPFCLHSSFSRGTDILQ